VENLSLTEATMADEYILKKIKAKVSKRFRLPIQLDRGPVFANKRSVAGTETDHWARVDSKLDVCWIKGYEGMLMAPFPNEIASEHLETGATVRTFLRDGPIWTAVNGGGKHGAFLDAVPSSPDHPNQGVGVKTMTKLGWASPTSSSKNVRIEGHGVVRSEDTTLQNNGNSTGIVNGVAYNVDIKFIREKLEKKCSLKSITGQCAHGRPVGFPPSDEKMSKHKQGESPMPAVGSSEVVDGNYLEVVNKSECVTFEVQLEDATLPDRKISAGECKKRSHPQWSAHRTGHRRWLSKESETWKAKQKIELGGSWMWVSHPFWDQSRRMFPFLQRLKMESPRIAVSVQACVGHRNATIVVFPRKRANLMLSSQGEEVEKWAGEKLGHLKQIEDWTKKIIDKLGLEKKGVQVVRRGAMNFSASFRELTKNKNGCTWVEANLRWRMEMGFDPLTGIRYERNIDDAKILARVAKLPYIGQALAGIMAVNKVMGGSTKIALQVHHALFDVFEYTEYKESTRAVDKTIELAVFLVFRMKWWGSRSIENETGVKGRLVGTYSPDGKTFLTGTGKGQAFLFNRTVIYEKDKAVGRVRTRAEVKIFEFDSDKPWKLF
jgi:hypothetical protein